MMILFKTRVNSLPVPKSDNFMSVNSDRNPKGSCQTKVCNLDGAILVDQQVGWLQVSVQDSSGMAENNGLKTVVNLSRKKSIH